MSRIVFENQRPDLSTDPSRADIACFVGLVRLAATVLASGPPPVVADWLQSQGWLTGPYARDVSELLDVPVPVDNYAGFMTIFDSVDLTSTIGTADYLAATVRSFFAQGGKRCYIVRMGDPIPTDPSIIAPEVAQIKQQMLQSVLVSLGHQASNPSTWHGIGHLSGLTDVSYLAVPDLPILSASMPTTAMLPTLPTPSGPVQFTECLPQLVTLEQPIANTTQAPRLSPSDYAGWAKSVAAILQYIASGTLRQELHLREIQFVAAFPLPRDAEDASIAALDQDVRNVFQTYLPESVEPVGSVAGTNLSSAFLQLAYPWLQTTGSYPLLESLEPPDGALVGIIARNALKRGAFTSATKITPSEIFGVWPSLPAAETKVSATPLVWGDGSPKPLIARLSLFGFTPGGLSLLSDVTAYPGESYRTACVNRLVSVICRAARNLGATIIFEQNGPALWGRLTRALQTLLTTAWSLGALDGATPADAFSVRCDASTMTQNDLDNGRLVAEIMFTAAATIELIRVTLALETDRMLPSSTTLPEAV
jgi:hypothetical protein